MKQQKFSNVRPTDVNYPIKKFASSERAFSELLLPKFNGLRSLRSGSVIAGTGLRPREVLGLYLMSLIATHLLQEEWTIGLDPFGNDGLVAPKSNGVVGFKRGLIIEQVYISEKETPFVSAFEKAVNAKVSKGSEYSKNLNLLVLSEYGQKDDLGKIVPIAQRSIFESCYLFILKQPIPYMFEAATLKSPADPLEYYHIGVNPADGSGKVIPKGIFKPVE